MMTFQTKKKTQNSGFFSKFWNEFLFAREFEYETPLTPDEVADNFRKIENLDHKSWMLSHARLLHDFTYERSGDKAGDFRIELVSTYRDKWWGTKSPFVYSEGTITAEQASGSTVISGRTRFSGRYYGMILAMFGLNFFIQSVDGTLFFQIFWLVMIVTFWFSIYRERNKLAERIDNIVMTAKSNESIATLVDSDDDNQEYYSEAAESTAYRDALS